MLKNHVKARRREVGITLKQLSRKSNVPVSSINAIENGREPMVKTAQRIARALGRTVEELWPD